MQPMETNGGAGIHLQPLEDPRLDGADEGRKPWEVHGGVDSWQDLWPSEEIGFHAGTSLLSGFVTL